jgi:hypothetical protein
MIDEVKMRSKKSARSPKRKNDKAIASDNSILIIRHVNCFQGKTVPAVGVLQDLLVMLQRESVFQFGPPSTHPKPAQPWNRPGFSLRGKSMNGRFQLNRFAPSRSSIKIKNTKLREGVDLANIDR